MKNKYLKFAVMELTAITAALTLSTPAQARTDEKGFLDSSIKREISAYAETMGTKDRFSNSTSYFEARFNQMGAIAGDGDLHKCSSVAKKLKDTYRDFQITAKESIEKNVDLATSKNSRDEIITELYEGKNQYVVTAKMAELRKKSFALGDCMRQPRPTK